MYMDALPAYLCTMCVQCSHGPEEDAYPLELELEQLTGWCWELNLVPLEKQPVLLSAHLSLWAPCLHF